MSLIQRDYVIRHLPATTANPALRDSVLPWTPDACANRFYAACLQELDDITAEYLNNRARRERSAHHRIQIVGSEQEFDKKPILCGFPEKHEFGLGDSHTLSLEEQVA